MNSGHTSGLFVELIAKENVPLVWILIKDKIKETLEDFGEGERDENDLFVDLASGNAQLWIVTDSNYSINSVAVTRVVRYAKKRRLLFDLLIGEDFDNLQHTLSHVDDFMRKHGLKDMEAHVRPGFAKILLSRKVFRRNRVVLFREIKPC